jgi:hypothetical protein
MSTYVQAWCLAVHFISSEMNTHLMPTVRPVLFGTKPKTEYMVLWRFVMTHEMS